MSDSEEQHVTRPAEFTRLSEFAQRGSVFTAPERIRALGMRRLRRRRAGQAVLGTGALAAVVFLGAGFVGSGHPSSAVGAGAGGTATSRVIQNSPSVSVWYQFPETLSGVSASTLEHDVQWVGFRIVDVKSEASETVPQGDAIDVQNDRHESLLGKEASTDMPLTLVISTGPAR